MRADGIQPVLVGSGAVDVGAARLASAGIPHAPAARQLSAAVGQGLLMGSLRAALGERGLIAAQILLTPLDLTGAEHRDSSRTVLDDALGSGLVPVVHENDAVMVRNSDVLAALVAASLKAARLLLFTDAPGAVRGRLRPGPPGPTDPRSRRHDPGDRAARRRRAVRGLDRHLGGRARGDRRRGLCRTRPAGPI
ncbi:hypothetical protein J7E94_28150 [Streptomyces sp. ISL-94]|nr:hypothetical protein [Streptomyces sp. ISL-94]